MIDYLLGALPEAESERFDELSITDDEFAGRLQIVENDLVDAYARGELSGQRLEKFNSIYLTSPKRREMVRFAKTFQSFTNQGSTLQTETPRAIGVAEDARRKTTEPHTKWWHFFSIPRWSLQWGLAAATLVLVFMGGYLVVENARLRNQMNAVQAEREVLQKREQELQTALANERQADAETASELERVRERLAELERQQLINPKDEKPEPPPTDSPKVAAFTLAPQLRGVGQIAKVNVPVGTDVVVLQLELESKDFSLYQVALKNPATRQIIWRSGKLKPSAQTIPVRIRAALLQPQNYTLELSGISASGNSDIVGSYTFTVVKP
jgi:hypothetical protein